MSKTSEDRRRFVPNEGVQSGTLVVITRAAGVRWAGPITICPLDAFPDDCLVLINPRDLQEMAELATAQGKPPIWENE